MKLIDEKLGGTTPLEIILKFPTENKVLNKEEDEFDDVDKPEDTKPDIYIHRLENDQRAKPIPDIKKLLIG